MENRVTNLIWLMVGLVVVVAAVSVILSFVFGWGSYSGNYGPFGMMGYGYYGMGLIMPIIGAISVIFVIVFVYILIDAGRRNEWLYSNGSSATPEEIAKSRLARGEINEAEFKVIMEHLKR